MSLIDAVTCHVFLIETSRPVFVSLSALASRSLFFRKLAAICFMSAILLFGTTIVTSVRSEWFFLLWRARLCRSAALNAIVFFSYKLRVGLVLTLCPSARVGVASIKGDRRGGVSPGNFLFDENRKKIYGDAPSRMSGANVPLCAQGARPLSQIKSQQSVMP